MTGKKFTLFGRQVWVSYGRQYCYDSRNRSLFFAWDARPDMTNEGETVWARWAFSITLHLPHFSSYSYSDSGPRSTRENGYYYGSMRANDG